MKETLHADTEILEEVGTDMQLMITAALSEHRNDVMSSGALSQSDLEERISIDDPEKFEEELSSLEGDFIVKNEDGYRLRYAGKKLHETMLALEYADKSSRQSTETEYNCPVCKKDMQAVYEDSDLTHICPDHGEIVRIPISPTTAAHGDMSKILEVADIRPKQQLEMAQAGVCWNCRGPMSADLLVEPPNRSQAETASDPPLAKFNCNLCGTQFGVLISQCLALDATVRSFYRDRGCDLTEISFIDLEAAINITSVEHCEQDPTRIRVEVERDGDLLTVTLDGHARVIEDETAAIKN